MQKNYSFIFKSVQETHAWGKRFGSLLQPGDVIALVGGLGTGKTTLTQSIAQGWGYREEVTSPTFSLVNEYRSRKGFLFHMDLYRLTAKELKHFEFEEYMQEGICVIEWADRARNRWPQKTLEIQLTTINNHQRQLKFIKPNAEWKQRLD